MSPTEGYFTYSDSSAEGEQRAADAAEAASGDSAVAEAASGDCAAAEAAAEAADAWSSEDIANKVKPKDGIVHVAAFDFDGTCMDGNSPVRLVVYLMKKRMIHLSAAARVGLWGARYKFRLPANEAWVRGMVFTAFEGLPADDVNTFLYQFYDEDIAPRFRPDADIVLRNHIENGDAVLIVSATFEPIIERMMQSHPITGQVSTRMKIAPDGTYTRDVEGKPIEGEEKLCAIKRWCDEHYGEGKWELTYAYGDHHSDRPMLDAAKHAIAVDPDRPLTRTATAKGWGIADWQ